MSLGIRSGVNWIRANSIAHTCAKERASRVLPSPGRSSISTWPSASRANNTSSTASLLPMIACSTASVTAVASSWTATPAFASSVTAAPAARSPFASRRRRDPGRRASRRERHVDAAAAEACGDDRDEQRPERPVDAELRLLRLPQVVHDLAQPQRHLVVPRTRRWLLPPRGSELQRGRGGERGGERQRSGERDRPALPEHETQGGRRHTTGRDEEQRAAGGHRGATSPST